MEFSRPEYWSGFLSLLQGSFPTRGTNPGLPHCRQILYHLSYKGSPCERERICEPKLKGKCSLPFFLLLMCIISVPKYRSGLGSENVMREHSNGEDIEYLQIINTISECMGFPDSSVDKESTCNAGDPGSITG